MKKKILFTVATILLVCCIHSQSLKKFVNKNQVRDSIELVLNKTLKDKNLPGINFSVIDNNDKIENYSVGYSDLENKDPLSIGHTFFSGSIGKTYAATLVFRLIESGDIKLNKTFKSYFPDTSWILKLPNINQITIEMLLQHTSGLPRYVLKPEIWNQLYENPDKVWTYEERLKVIFEDEPVHEAGKGWAYSDTNYILLGMLIEKVTGENYYDLVQSEILEPKSLEHTYPSLSRNIENLSAGYSRLPPDFHVPNKTLEGKSYFMNPQVEWTGGGMASTTSDLAKWAKLYYEGQLVSKESLISITTPNSNGKHVEGTSSYGMGSFIYETAHGKAFGHTGFMPGFNSIFVYYPKYGIAAAININCDYAVGVLNLNDFMDNLISISQTKK